MHMDGQLTHWTHKLVPLSFTPFPKIKRTKKHNQVELLVHSSSLLFTIMIIFSQNPPQSRLLVFILDVFQLLLCHPWPQRNGTLKMTVPPSGVCIKLQAYLPLGYILEYHSHWNLSQLNKESLSTEWILMHLYKSSCELRLTLTEIFHKLSRRKTFHLNESSCALMNHKCF